MGVNTNANAKHRYQKNNQLVKCNYTEVQISQHKHYYHASNMQYLRMHLITWETEVQFFFEK